MQTTLTKRSTVFVINDQPFACMGMAQLVDQTANLELCGQASSAEEATELLKKQRPGLVLTEVCLRARLCLEFITEIREKLPNARILVVSRKPEAVFAERSLRVGAHGYVSLLSPTQLVEEAIERVLAGEVYLSPNAKRRVLGRLVGNRDADLTEDPCNALTNRELHVFRHFGRGMSAREIAAELELSVKTIETYREKLKVKLGMKSSFDLMRYAMECHVFDFHRPTDPLG